ncbi:MAG TPA: serine/threonine-protein kinase [Gaiellaceae bacterium]|nr:serine/threonine-protein kinase [Gaiellaceae bacterium]
MAVETGILPARYRDPKLVARGGMGEVYCATDTSLGRPVAVKLLDVRIAADETVRKRFTREALAAARVSGEAGSVTIFDVGEWNDRPFIVMEYLDGGSLQDVMREGSQPPRRVLPWLEQTARALDHAHEQGVVHRDVKPANLLLDAQDRVHVADFGVATAAGLATLTQTGTIIGTAGYLSPEQAQGWESTPASDRYGLAVVAFELLTGSRPFENANQAAEAAAHVNAAIPSASQRARDLPPQVDAVFERALAKNPDNRFSSCGEFVAALRAALDDAAGATRPTPMRPVHAPRRSFALPLVIALLLAAGIATAVYATTRSHGKTPPTARVTITRQGTTVHETVTAQAPTTQPTTTPAAPSTTSSSTTSNSAGTLAEQGYAKLQAGDYAGAVPLLQQAAQALQGSGTISEAYNDYNLAYALTKSQGCSTQVLQLLDASQTIQGHRSEIDQLRAACKHP